MINRKIVPDLLRSSHRDMPVAKRAKSEEIIVK